MNYHHEVYGRKTGLEVAQIAVKKQKNGYEHQEGRIMLKFFELESGKKDSQIRFKMTPTEAYQLADALERVKSSTTDDRGVEVGLDAKLKLRVTVHKFTPPNGTEMQTELYVERFSFGTPAKVGFAIGAKRGANMQAVPLSELERRKLVNDLPPLSFAVSYATNGVRVEDVAEIREAEVDDTRNGAAVTSLSEIPF